MADTIAIIKGGDGQRRLRVPNERLGAEAFSNKWVTMSVDDLIALYGSVVVALNELGLTAKSGRPELNEGAQRLVAGRALQLTDTPNDPVQPVATETVEEWVVVTGRRPAVGDMVRCTHCPSKYAQQYTVGNVYEVTEVNNVSDNIRDAFVEVRLPIGQQSIQYMWNDGDLDVPLYEIVERAVIQQPAPPPNFREQFIQYMEEMNSLNSIPGVGFALIQMRARSE